VHRYGTFFVRLVLGFGVFFLAALPAHAQMRGGVQGGISVDPDQVYFGAHVETEPLIDRLRFRPNVEIGVGDHTTLVAINFEFKYLFPTRSPWDVYVGAGPAMNFYRFSGGGSDTRGGFNFLVGAQNSRGLFFEFKVGAIDSPELKFGVGYTFR